MRARELAIALVLLGGLVVPTTSCKAARQVADSGEELIMDAWAPGLGVLLGSLAGPAGMIVGGTLGGAYAVTRQRLYSAQEMAEAFRTGKIYGRQQAIDLADAARGAPIQAHPQAEPSAWTGERLLRVLGVVLIVVGWLRREKWKRVLAGPDRLRALENLYLGPLAKLPPLPGDQPKPAAAA